MIYESLESFKPNNIVGSTSIPCHDGPRPGLFDFIFPPFRSYTASIVKADQFIGIRQRVPRLHNPIKPEHQATSSQQVGRGAQPRNLTLVFSIRKTRETKC